MSIIHEYVLKSATPLSISLSILTVEKAAGEMVPHEPENDILGLLDKGVTVL